MSILICEKQNDSVTLALDLNPKTIDHAQAMLSFTIFTYSFSFSFDDDAFCRGISAK